MDKYIANKSELPWPICAKCNKPVETIRHEYNPCDMYYYIAVTCHGEKDNCKLDSLYTDFKNLGQGYAFQDIKKLDRE